MSKKLYSVYKTINKTNNKEYIGFHSVSENEIVLTNKSETGSIFSSGYLGSGKLIKSAIEKYGPENFKQELIYITENREEAEELEKDLVNKNWVDSDSNYNVSIGGNVCILYGENNGFYGQKHTKETLDKIQESRNKTLKEQPFSWSEIYIVDDPNKVFYNKNEVVEYYNLNGTDLENKRTINKMVFDGILKYKSNYLNDVALRQHNEYVTMINNSDSIKQKLAEECSKRFKGVPKTAESNIKRGTSIKEWIENNPDEHIERMNKINKNPEKIAKTAEKHRGMKRSLNTKINIAKSQKNCKQRFKNLNTSEIRVFNLKTENPDTNWEKCFYQLYIDSNESIKAIYISDKVPEGFSLYTDEIY